MSKRNLILGLLLAASVFGVFGCGTPQTASEGVFLQNGLPAQAYRVGGGFQIRYLAPEAGAVYLVEHRTGTLLGTESLLRNQVFEFFPTEEVVAGFSRVGIELAQGEFVLYFIPASKLYRR